MTKETKELVIFCVLLTEALDHFFSTKNKLKMLVKFIPAALKFPSALQGIEKVPAEIRKLTEEDRKELVYEIEQLKLRDVNVEQIAEQGLRMAVELSKFLAMFAKARA